MGQPQARERTVLMLASGFPPDEQYILRTAKFAEYLPEFGWRPVVLTPMSRAARRTGMQAPTDVRRVRVPGLPSPSRLLLAARRWVPHRRDQVSGDRNAPDGSRESLPGRLLRQALLWLDTPDALAGWIPAAVVGGVALALRHDVRAIHASGPPFSVIVSGVLLSSLLRRPLVADFRDAWTLDSRDPFGTLGGGFRVEIPPARTGLLARLERWTLRRSSAVLFTSRSTLHLYAEHHGDLASRFRLIFNGADEADFRDPCQPSAAPTITHVGTLHDYQWSQVRELLDDLAGLRRAGAVPSSTRLVLVGPIGISLRERIAAEVQATGLGEAVVLPGSVPHAEAVAWMRRSWLQILFAGDNPYVRLSKLSECFAAGPPMLTFGDAGGETAREVLELGGVVAPSPGSPVARDCLVQALREPPKLAVTPRIEHPHPLSRRTEAGYLADLLDRAVDP